MAKEPAGFQFWIIIRQTEEGVKFWNGRGWSAEYPDAQQYTKRGATAQGRRIESETGVNVLKVFAYGTQFEEATIC